MQATICAAVLKLQQQLQHGICDGGVGLHSIMMHSAKLDYRTDAQFSGR